MNNNNKLIITFLVLILCVGVFVTAQTLLSKNFEVVIDNTAKIQLDSMGLNNPEHSELDCGKEICKFSMWKDMNDGDRFNLGNHKIPARKCLEYSEVDNETEYVSTCLQWQIYSVKELETMMSDKIKDKLNFYGETFKQRKQEQTETKVGSGLISMK